MVFREIIGEVSGSWLAVYAEHFLRFFTSHPIKAHVPRLASLALHVIVTHTMRSGVCSFGWASTPADGPSQLGYCRLGWILLR